MTQIKYKSFKGRENLEEDLNNFMASNGVSEIVHVSSHSMPGSTLSYIDLFYKQASKRGPKASPKPTQKSEGKPEKSELESV